MAQSVTSPATTEAQGRPRRDSRGDGNHVAPSADTIEAVLAAQLARWQTVPEYVRWWNEADGSQQEAFALEWVGVGEQRLHDLQRWAREGQLTPAQAQRYAELQELIGRHRPTIAPLIAEYLE